MATLVVRSLSRARPVSDSAIHVSSHNTIRVMNGRPGAFVTLMQERAATQHSPFFGTKTSPPGMDLHVRRARARHRAGGPAHGIGWVMRERLMAQDIIPRLSNLRSRLSLPAQLGLLGVLILASGVGLLAWRAGERAVAERSESNQPAHAETAPGTFRPTAAQWASLKFQTVPTMAFRRERVTEGNIAIDDDLTTAGVLALFRAGDQSDRACSAMSSRKALRSLSSTQASSYRPRTI